MAYVLQNMANVRNRLTQSPSATEDLRDKGHTNIPASGPRAPTWVQTQTHSTPTVTKTHKEHPIRRHNPLRHIYPEAHEGARN